MLLAADNVRSVKQTSIFFSNDSLSTIIVLPLFSKKYSKWIVSYDTFTSLIHKRQDISKVPLFKICT